MEVFWSSAPEDLLAMGGFLSRGSLRPLAGHCVIALVTDHANEASMSLTSCGTNRWGYTSMNHGANCGRAIRVLGNSSWPNFSDDSRSSSQLCGSPAKCESRTPSEELHRNHSADDFGTYAQSWMRVIENHSDASACRRQRRASICTSVSMQ